MPSATSTVRALSLSCLGAVLALGFSGLMPGNQAEAQRPGRLARCQADLAQMSARLQQAESDLVNYQAAYRELLAGLDRVERINDNQSQKARKRIRKAVYRARRRAGSYVAPAPAPVPAPVPSEPGYEPVPQPGPEIISRRAFKRLLRSVEQKSFDSERLATIREAVQYNAFTVRHAIKLINACTFEDTKVDVAIALYPYVVDIDRWFQVYDAFTFASSRKKIERRISP